jgi:hypothetical protein
VGKNFAVLDIFLLDIYRDPLSTIFFQISKLIFDTLLWAGDALSHQCTSSPAGCQISILIFENKLCRGDLYRYPIKIYQGRQSSCPLLAKLNVLPGS